MMRIQSLPMLFAVSSLVWSTSTAAQEPEKAKDLDKSFAAKGTVAHLVKANVLIGAKVQNTPGVPIDGRAADARGDARADAKQVNLGDVKDLVVDVARGRASIALLSNGELYTVGDDNTHGIGRLWWDEANKRFVMFGGGNAET